MDVFGPSTSLRKGHTGPQDGSQILLNYSKLPVRQQKKNALASQGRPRGRGGGEIRRGRAHLFFIKNL